MPPPLVLLDLEVEVDDSTDVEVSADRQRASLNVGQRQLHFHRRVVLAAGDRLQFGHQAFPDLVGQLVGVVKLTLELPQRTQSICESVRRAEPPFHVAAAAVVIDALIFAECSLAYDDVDSLARAGEEWDGIEAHLRAVGNKRVLYRITGLELLAEGAVVSNVEYQHRAALLKNVLVIASH